MSLPIPLETSGGSAVCHHAETLRAVRAERHARLTWCSLIIFMLFGSVGMWIYAAVLAVSDPSMAVVPDYHEKALQWDKHLDVQRATQALGWTIAYVPGPPKDASGMRELTLFIRDRDARPVCGASGRLRLYHHARAGAAVTTPLVESEPGTYVCSVTMARAGYWQMELTLDRGDEHIESSSVYELLGRSTSAAVQPQQHRTDIMQGRALLCCR
jgi:nitrogen fixation protein FixH